MQTKFHVKKFCAKKSLRLPNKIKKNYLTIVGKFNQKASRQ